MKKYTYLIIPILLLSPFFIIYLEESGDIVEVKNSSEQTKIKIEILKLTQEGQAFLRQGKVKEIVSIAQKIKSLSDTSPESYYLSGAVKYINGEYKQAILDLETGLKSNPNHDPSIFLLGLIYIKLYKIDTALNYFERACKEASYNPFYRINLAITTYISGNYTKAKLEAETTIKLKENYSKAKIILAFSLYRLGKKSDSMMIIKELFEKKIEFDDIQGLYVRLLLEESKNYEEVIQILAKKNKLNMDEKKLLAIAFMEEGQYLKAIQFYKIIIDAGMDTEEDNLNYLKSMIMVGKSEEAEKLFLELNKKNFKDKKIYIETYFQTLEKKFLLRQLYQPFPI